MEQEEGQPTAAAEEISIDTIAPVANRIGKLSQKRQDFVRCLANDMKPEQIANELDLSLSTVTQYKTVIFSELRLQKSLGIKNRLRILKEAWELHIRTKTPPIATSLSKPPQEMSPRTESQPTQEPAPTQEVPDDEPRFNMAVGGALPVVFFDKPHEIVGIQVIPAVGMIPTSLIEEGYQCEASVASHDKSTPTVNAFLVMVLRK